MTPTITAFESSPDRGRGLARDFRVRWALEEVGQPYRVRLLTFAAMKQPAHRALHPFGQIPTYEDGEVALFETGAIVLHLAQRHSGLLPNQPTARARAIAWMFAAVGSVEPVVVEHEMAGHAEGDRPWFAERMKIVDARIDRRLGELAAHLGDANWLDSEFTAGDLMMVDSLRRLDRSDLQKRHPALAVYVARAEGRPAFTRAYAGQRAVFEAQR